jgi:hypothetical protein
MPDHNMMSKPLYAVRLAGKLLTGFLILLYGTIFLSLKPAHSVSSNQVDIIFFVLLFAGVAGVFLLIFLKMKNPWWAGIPFVLCLAFECLILSIVLFSIYTDPAYSPLLEVLPFAYWILSGIGLMISSVIVAGRAFVDGYKNGRDGTAISK